MVHMGLDAEHILSLINFLFFSDGYEKYRANGIEQEVRAEPILLLWENFRIFGSRRICLKVAGNTIWRYMVSIISKIRGVLGTDFVKKISE